MFSLLRRRAGLPQSAAAAAVGLRGYASWPTAAYLPLASQRRAALYGSASTITWPYSLDVLYLSYMTWYSSSAESSGAKRERSERVRL